jgi:hypothetical protein
MNLSSKSQLLDTIFFKNLLEETKINSKCTTNIYSKRNPPMIGAGYNNKFYYKYTHRTF